MSIQHPTPGLALGLLCAAWLSACGGGGGDGGESSDSGITPATAGSAVAVSDSNYLEIGSSTARLLGSSGARALSQISAASRVSRESAASAPTLDKQQALASASRTYACATSGTRTVTLEDNGTQEKIDAGDKTAAIYANCITSGVRLNGGMHMTFGTVTGDYPTPPYSAQLGITYDDFLVSSSGISVTARGTVSASVSRSSTTDSSDAVTYHSLQLKTSAGAQTEEVTLNGLQAVLTSSASRDTYTLSGQVTSSTIGNQSFTIRTVNAFVTPAGQTYPTSGQAIVQGSDKATVTVSVLTSPANTVRMAYDANGDGTPEKWTDKAWSEFD